GSKTDEGKHDTHDSSKSKGDSSGIQLGGGVVLSKDVKATPNGNTGFSGLGVPGGKSTSSFTATSGSSLGVFASSGTNGGAQFNRADTLAGDRTFKLKSTQLIGRNDDGSSSTTSTGGRQSNDSTSGTGT